MSLLDIEIEEAEETQVESAEYKELVLKGDIDALAAQVEQIELKTDEDVEEAAIWLRKNKQTQKIVKDFFEADRAATYAAYKEVTDKIKRFTDILTRTERTVKNKMGDFQMEKERKRREEEAKRRAEEEKRRREEEAKRIEAEKAGNPAPPPAPEPVVAPLPQEEEKAPEGISYIETWEFEIEDKSQIPLEYMVPDEKKIRATVKALKADAKIPGVKVFSSKSVRAR